MDELTAVCVNFAIPFPRSPRDRADSELTDTQTDPQIDQSDDDQLEDSPRDESTASSTEAQELRLQLTELRELLAQKVLLINELQGAYAIVSSRYAHRKVISKHTERVGASSNFMEAKTWF